MINAPKTMDEKRLKREEFSLFDSAIATILFILIQFIFLQVYFTIPEETRELRVVLVIAQILIEGIFFLSVYLTARWKNVEWVSASGLKNKFDTKVIVFGSLVAIVMLVCFANLSDLFIYFLQSLGYKYKSSSVDVSNFFMYIIALVVHCAVPAFTEEMLFRGVICSGTEKINKHAAVFISAFLFMIMHGSPLQTIHQFILGVVYGYIFVYSHNIWITMFAHFLNNGLTVTLYYISTLLHPNQIIPDGTIMQFEQMTNNELWLNIAYAVALSLIGVICIIFILRAVKKHYEKREEMTASNTNNGKSVSNGKTENIFADQNKKREKIWAIIMYAIALISLLSDWVVALIYGFYL